MNVNRAGSSFPLGPHDSFAACHVTGPSQFFQHQRLLVRVSTTGGQACLNETLTTQPPIVNSRVKNNSHVSKLGSLLIPLPRDPDNPSTGRCIRLAIRATPTATDPAMPGSQ